MSQYPSENYRTKPNLIKSWIGKGLGKLLVIFPNGFRRFTQRFPKAHEFLTARIIDALIQVAPTRPEPLVCGWEYPTWEGLTNPRWTARHLPPRDPENIPPTVEDVAKQLFARETFRESEKSTLLFAYFAQWFTDGFLVSDVVDRSRNFSNHHIDLGQLYGLHPEQTELIRAMDGSGRLKTDPKNDGYPPLLYNSPVGPDELWKIDPQFRRERKTFRDFNDIGFQQLHRVEKTEPSTGMHDRDWKLLLDSTRKETIPAHLLYRELTVGQSLTRDPKYRQDWRAMANDRGNSTLGFTMFNVLFLRIHNALADKIRAGEGAGWDDERIFQTTRNTVIALAIQIVVEDYIGHISSRPVPLKWNPARFHSKAYKWKRTNRMAIEFNLLYRWHSMIPDELILGDRRVDLKESLWNPGLVKTVGLAKMFHYASAQPSGEIGVKNTLAGDMLKWTDIPMIQMGRTAKLATYNMYRHLYRLPPARDFKDISSDKDVVDALKCLYKTVDQVEFVSGIFAEDSEPNGAVGRLMGYMVGIDAFSQILTNPLLSERNWNAHTFGSTGWRMLKEDWSLQRLVEEYTTPEERGGVDDLFVSLTRKGWEWQKTSV